MTGKTGVWPVKSTIRPDIVRWPAVICSPEWLIMIDDDDDDDDDDDMVVIFWYT